MLAGDARAILVLARFGRGGPPPFAAWLTELQLAVSKRASANPVGPVGHQHFPDQNGNLGVSQLLFLDKPSCPSPSQRILKLKPSHNCSQLT